MVSVPEGLSSGAFGVAARQLERGDRGSVPARPADATRGDCALAVASFGSCAWANGWTKKSVSELVEALHETDNDER